MRNRAASQDNALAEAQAYRVGQKQQQFLLGDKRHIHAALMFQLSTKVRAGW